MRKNYFNIFNNFTLLIFLGLSINFLYLFTVNNFFWDIKIYQNASFLFNSDQNPYLNNGATNFVYSPLIAIFFKWLGNNLTTTLLISYAFSIIIFLKSKIGKSIFIFSLISSFLFTNIFLLQSLISGNLTIYVHFILIYIASLNNKYKTEILFISTLLASIIKPYFASYILFLFFNKLGQNKKFIYFISFCFLLLTVFLLQMIISNQLFKDFIFSLKDQSIGLVPGAGVDVGIGPYTFFAKIFKNKLIGLLLHSFTLIISGLAVLKKLESIKKFIPKIKYEQVCFLAFLIFINFLNPRLKVYDYWIIVAASTSIIFCLINIITPTQRNFLKILIMTFTSLIISTMFLKKFGYIDLPTELFSILSLYFSSTLGLFILPSLIDFNKTNRLNFSNST